MLSDGIIEFTPISEPIVSIILVLYNRAELTLSCLYSILHNSFKSVEVIIVDNNSSDRTRELYYLKFKGLNLFLMMKISIF